MTHIPDPLRQGAPRRLILGRRDFRFDLRSSIDRHRDPYMKSIVTLISIVILAALPMLAPAQTAEPAPIRDFLRYPSYSEVKLSPSGEYLAMTVSRGEKDVLVVLQARDMAVTSVTELPGNYSVGRFYWGNPKRLVFNAYIKTGKYALALPPELGFLYAVDIDGSRQRALYRDARTTLERGMQSAHEDRDGVYEVLDPLPDDEDNILVRILNPFMSGKKVNRLALLNIYDGRTRMFAVAPELACTFALDSAKRPNFAMCEDPDDEKEVHPAIDLYRRGDGMQWDRIHAGKAAGHALSVVGAATDGRVYAVRDDGVGTYEFGVLDDRGGFRGLFRDENADPAGYLTSATGDAILGVVTASAKPKITMIDEAHPDGELYASLAAAFPDQFVEFSNASSNGDLIVVSVRSDRNPGELYLYDRKTAKARFLMRRMQWIDPAKMASVRPVRIAARDGLTLHGYLTVPNGSNGKNLPMIVNVHGGPMGVRDDWGFHAENQLLASRGYLVLQVNFRGSGGRGAKFERMAYGQWNAGIIDDIVDATRWAVAQGHADEDRICIYGASFGGYAAMMAPAKAQGLFKCAFGYVGAYDAEIQMQDSDTAQSERGRRYLERALGDTKSVRAAASPVNHADKIRIPVYLAAGQGDARCPPQNTEAMQKALTAAGNPPEGVILQSGEGHGFYKEESNVRLYTEMLAFFSRHIGHAH